MAPRIPREWLVFDSIENDQHDRCVDLFQRPDGSFGFGEFRRDVEDAGAWTAVHYHGHAAFQSRGDALAAAVAGVAWLGIARG